jgi:hypothetical protein
MTLGAVLDVAFGLSFTFALLAIIASSIQEIIASVLSTRGKVLQSMMVQILSHQPTQPGVAAAVPAAVAPPGGAPDLATRVLGHPLIASLGTPNLPAWLSRWLNSAKLPSYVPSGNFATALIETLREGHDDTLAVSSQVSRAIALLPDNSPVKRSLQGFIIEAKGDLDAFRARVQAWYDDAMDRASGVYKRYAQYTLLVIGLILAVAINADIIGIADTLWRDKNMRDVVASAATEYMQQHPRSAGPATSQPPTSTTPTPGADSVPGEQEIRDASGVVAQLPIPLGWGNAGYGTSTNPGLMVARKILGLLLTAFAISLGAPFWFDMLQNIANLRGAGPKPARSAPDATT